MLHSKQLRASLRNLRALSILACCLIAIAASIQAQSTFTWTGASDSSWSNPANWSPFGIPSSNDIAVINSGGVDATALGSTTAYQIDLNGGSLTSAGLQIQTLNQNGGALAGSNNIPSGGVWNWTSGWFYGYGVVLPGGACQISSSGTKWFADGAEFHNHGSVTWTEGQLRGWTQYAPSTLQNHSGSTFIANGGSSTVVQYGWQYAYLVIDSGAMFTKTDAGDLTCDWRLNNNGTLAMTGGRLFLGGQGGDSSGLYTNTPGTTLSFYTGTHTLRDGARFVGEGRQGVDGGTLDIQGAVTAGVTNSTGSFELTSGYISGSSFTAQGTFNWTGGRIGGLFTVAPGAVLNASGSGDSKWLLDGAVFENQGTMNWQGGGTFRSWTQYGTATLNIRSNAVLNISADGEVFSRYYSWQPFYVSVAQGALIHKTAGTGNQFNNINLDLAGELRVDSGAITLNTPTMLEAGARFTGPGTVQQVGDGVALYGLLTVDGGMFSVAGGTFAMGAAGGIVSTINGATFDWSGGWLYGSLTLPANTTSFFGTGDNKWFGDGAVLHNYGQITWSGGPLRAYTYSGSATLENHPGSTFVANGGGGWALYYGYVTAYFLIDAGATFTKTDAGDLSCGWRFNNNGVCSLTGGRLYLSGQGGDNSGLFTNAPGTTLAFYTSTHTMRDGVRFAGPGVTSVEGGVLDIQGAVVAGETNGSNVFALSSGWISGNSFTTLNTFNWTGGYIAGQFTVAPGAVLNASGGDLKWFYDGVVFDNRGTLNWLGGGTFRGYTYGGPAWLNIHSNAVFNLAADGTVFSRHYGYQPFYVSLAPGGLLHKAAVTDNYLDNIVLSHVGELRVDGGTVTLNTPVTLEDGALCSGAGTVQMVGNQTVFNGLLTLDGTGFSTLGGTMAMGGAGGTVRTLNGAVFNWSAGWLYGALTLASNSTATLTSADMKGFGDGAELRNHGQLTWTGGSLRGYTYGNTATLHNFPAGHFTLSGSLNLTRTYAYQPAYFINDGTLTIGTPGAVVGGDWQFTQGPSGVMELALAGTTADTDFGHWATSQGATLGGTLRVQLANSFAPTAGEVFTFLDGSGHAGTFSGLELPALPAGLALVFEETSSSLSLRVAQPGPCAPPPAGLTAWFAGEDSPLDLVGLRQGQLVNGTSYAYGKTGRAFHLDGSDDYVDIGQLPELSGAQEFTVMAWVRPSTASHPYGGIVGKWNSTPCHLDNTFLLYLGEGGYGGYGALALNFSDNSCASAAAGNSIPVGQWTHVAATWRSSDGAISIYKNGALDGTNSGGMGQTLKGHTAYTAKIGEWGAVRGSDYKFPGDIDEVMIFTRALEASEVAAIATADISGVCRTNANCVPPPSSLVGWWPGDVGGTDLAGTNTGTLGSGTTTAPSMVGSAFLFNGAGAVVDVGNNPSVQASSGDFTAMAWVEFNQLGGDMSILDKMANCGAGNCDGWRLIKQSDGRFWFCLGGGAGNGCADGSPTTLQSTTLPAASQWYHVAAVKNASAISLYVNGALEQTKPLPTFTDTHSADLLIGASLQGAYLNGMVDEAMLFSRALDPSEISAIFAATTAGVCGSGITNQPVTNNLPELRIVNVSAPTSALMGQPVPIVFTITNSGHATAVGPWANQFLLANDAQGSGAQALGSISFIGLLAASNSVTITQTVTLPAGVFGQHHLGVKADSEGNILELSETNNTTFAASAITITAPDLSVTAVTAPASALIAQAVTVVFTVTNNGDAPALAPWNCAFYLATDASGGGAQYLGALTLANDLAAGASVTVTQAVTLPGNASGSRFLGVAADSNNNVPESNESNNGAYAALPTAIAAPDLWIAEVSGPATVLMDQSVPVVFTITNSGDAPALAPWQNQFLLANDALGNGAQSLGLATFTNDLPPGASLTVTQTVALPVGVAGTKFLGVLADYYNNALESNEANNAAYAASAIVITAPDLRVARVSAPASALMGQGVPVVITITNAGDSTAVAPWMNQILLATDALGTSAGLFGSVSLTNDLPASASISLTQSVILPAGLIGTFYFGAATDSAGNVPESNEANNTTYADTAIAISGPDLAATTLTAPGSAQFGETFTVSFAVTNVGAVAASASWNDQLFLSTSASSIVGATPLATLAGTSPLAAGDGYERSQSVTLPLSTSSSAGNYFIVAVADAGGAQVEASEANNLIAVPITLALPPLPDLAIAEVTAPASTQAGLAVTVVWSVTNQGTLGLTNAAWSEVVSISNANGTVSALAEFLTTNTLAPGEFLVRTQDVVLPSSTGAGDIVYLVTTDFRHDHVELNESNNTTAAASVTTIPAQLTLTLATGNVNEGGPAFTGTIARNGSTAATLEVFISNSRPDKLGVTDIVNIPAGAASVTFSLTPLANALVDGDVLVTLNANADDYVGSAAGVVVRNVDVPQLALSFASPLVGEGFTVAATVSRDFAVTQDLNVVLSSSDPSRLLPPTSVTIPSNQLSLTFAVLAVENTLVEGTITNLITANASGFAPAYAAVGVIDNDLPSVVLTLASTNVSEGDGPMATRATLTRSPVTARPLVIDVGSSNPGKATVPQTFVIPENEATVSFLVSAVDNQIVDGDATVQFRVYIRASGTTRILAEGTGASLLVRDDDGPSLRLTIARDVVPEGQSPATTGTVTRNTSTNAPLVVTLSSANTGAATVPASVTIPAGSLSATFPIASVDDGVPSGNRSAVLTASAGGYTPGLSSLVVSDIQLPDLVVSSITVPTNGNTDANFTLGYRISNQGLAAANSNILTRFYLSSDAAIGGDTLLGEYMFSGTLNNGQYFDQTMPFRLPAAAGQYWIVVITDADNRSTEIREDNNSAISAVPIVVESAYSATVQASLTTGVVPTNVVLTGHATKRGGGNAVSVPVNVHVHLRGTHRTQQAITDASGNFSTVFTPLPNEAGAYEVGAAHPGEPDAAAQATFTLLGVALSPASLPVLVTEGTTVTGAVSVVNIGDTTLSGLSASVVSAPANLVVTTHLDATTVSGQGSIPLTFTVQPTDLSVLQGLVTVQVASTEGPVAQAALYVGIAPLRSQLVAIPGSLYSSMPIGGQQRVQFTVANLGGVTSGPVTVSVPNLPWLTVASTNPLPPFPPQSSNTVTLLLTPATNVDLGPYTGSLVAFTDDSSVSVPFTFLAMSEALGTLQIEAVDEFTFYASGSPKVSNAVVILTDPVTHTVVTNGTTDGDGLLTLPDIREAYYDVEVAAPQHIGYKGSVLVHGGGTNKLQTFLSREMVQYRWSVVPTTVEDRTRITIETTFETDVPVPVVTIHPAMFDLADVQGDLAQVTLQVTNHGLVAAEEFTLTVGTHPNWEIIPLVTNFGRLPAQSSLSIPVTLRRIGGSEPSPAPQLAKHAAKSSSSSGSASCGVSLGAFWNLLCGEHKKNYGTQVSFINAGNCGGYVGNGNPGVPSGQSQPYSPPGGGGSGGGWPYIPPPPQIGQPIVSHPNYAPPITCQCDPATFVPQCFSMSAGGAILQAAADAVASALKSVPNLEDVGIKLGVDAKLCTCCDDDGIGLKLEGGGSIELSGKVSIPIAGTKLKGTKTANGYEIEYDLQVGCAFEPGFTAKGSVQGKTDCHFKNPEACAEVSVSADLALECRIGGEFVFKQGGVEVGRQEAAVSATLKSGVQGSVSYCLAGGLSGKVCVQPVTLDAGVTLNFANVDFELKWEHEFTEEACWPSDSSPAPAAAIAQAANAKINSALQQLNAAMPQPAKAKAVAPVVRAAKSDAPPAGDGICARVKLHLNQDLVLTRDAFNATLELDNLSATSTLSNIQVFVSITDTNGQPANDLFGIRNPVVTGLGGVDGTGSLGANSSGSSSWILIPTRDAAPVQPTLYGVGGLLSYWQDGHEVVIPLYSAPITVNPDPILSVKYFHERDVYSDDPFTPQVEPSVPFNLAVMVDNYGHGTAHNVKIISGQPQIVENEKGLLIDFKIIGSQVNGLPQSPSLTVNFGDIAPNSRGIGRWLLTSTLQGHFTDYTATWQHIDDLGKTNLSLIDSVSIHEMIHTVQAQGALEDGLPDFLVNDIGDPDSLPDTLYLSDGSTSSVQVVQIATTDGAAAPGHLAVQLTAAMPSGWAYLLVGDPGGSDYILQRVVRSDNVEIYMNTNVWTTDRTFIGGGHRPRLENRLHLLDRDSTGSYTLHYAPRPAPDTTAPASTVAALPPASYSHFNVSWSGDDGADGSGVSTFDVFVSDNGGPFAPWLQGTTLSGSIFAGESGHTYAFYSLATDGAGNHETAPLAPQAQTTVSLVNSPPTISVVPSVALNSGETLSLDVTASDPDAGQVLQFILGPGAPGGVSVNPATGHLTWPTPDIIGTNTYNLAVIVTDNGFPALSATGVVAVTVRAYTPAPSFAQAPPNQTLALGTNCVLLLPDLRSSASAIGRGVTFTQVPAPGTPVGPGPHTVSFTAQNIAGSASIQSVFTVSANPPVAIEIPLGTKKGSSQTLDAGRLLSMASNPDRRSLAVASVGASAHGGTLSLSGTDIVYTPPTNFTGADSFTYTIQDCAGLTGTATVNVTVSASAPLRNIESITVAPGTVTVKARGIPGVTYGLQRATSLDGPWETMSGLTATASSTGLLIFVDTDPPESAFYRTMYPATP